MNNPIGFSLISGPILFIHFFLLCAIIVTVLLLMISFQRKIVMRGALIIVMAVSLLIVGILVMKNMGVDSSTGVIKTQTKQYTQSAKSIAGEADERTDDLREQMNRAGQD
jgi:general stress protein CsbA